MKIVLLDDVINVGSAGEIVDVKNGYGRNFLIPQKMAERATADAINRIELIRRAAETKRAKRLGEAAAKFALLADKDLVIAMKAGTESRLFGAVTSAMIADQVKIQFDVDLERRHIMLEEPIKHLGDFNVPLRASSDVTGEIKVVIEPEYSAAELEQKLIEQDRREREEAEAAVAAEAAAKAEAADAVMATEAAETIEKYEAHDAKQDEPEPEPEG